MSVLEDADEEGKNRHMTEIYIYANVSYQMTHQDGLVNTLNCVDERGAMLMCTAEKKKGTGCPVPFNLVLAELTSSGPRTSSSTARNYI